MTPLSLQHVIRALRPAPLDLQLLAHSLTQGKSVHNILSMASKYLQPADAEQVMAAPTPGDAALNFAMLFSDTVFPLALEYMGIDPMTDAPWDEETPLDPERITGPGIPYRPLGIECEYEIHELHEIAPPSLIPICALMDLLHIGDAALPGADTPDTWTRHMIAESAALHNVWLEHLEHQLNVPRALLKRIPEHGYAPAHFQAAIRGTAHADAEGVVIYIGRTEENNFLAWYDGEQPFEYHDPWTDENIQAALQEWHRAQAVLTQRDDYLAAHQERVPAQTEELIHILESHPGVPPIDHHT